jgi:hypothetical protein
MEKLNLLDATGVSVSRGILLPDELKPMGRYQVEHIRDGKIIGVHEFPNGIVTVGKNALLDSFFRNTAPPAAWYTGLVDNASFSAFAAADTMSSHAGWIEATIYTEATRVQWSPGAASAGSITNGTVMTFNINATGTIKGIFVVSNNTKGGTTGTLWSTAAFGSTVAVNNTDQLKITYTLSC